LWGIQPQVNDIDDVDYVEVFERKEHAIVVKMMGEADE